jgi:hypothetical protein
MNCAGHHNGAVADPALIRAWRGLTTSRGEWRTDAVAALEEVIAAARNVAQNF